MEERRNEESKAFACGKSQYRGSIIRSRWENANLLRLGDSIHLAKVGKIGAFFNLTLPKCSSEGKLGRERGNSRKNCDFDFQSLRVTDG